MAPNLGGLLVARVPKQSKLGLFAWCLAFVPSIAMAAEGPRGPSEVVFLGEILALLICGRLMGELMEDHIRHHMPRNSKSSEEAADDVIHIVRTYLK